MLDFHWIVELKDGSFIKQFDGEKETSYKVVEENKNNVKTLKLVSTDGNETTYTADLTTGNFNFNGVKILSGIDVSFYEHSIEPIFFVVRRATLFGEIKEHVIGYKIGWRATIEGRTVEQLFVISPVGEIVAPPKVL